MKSPEKLTPLLKQYYAIKKQHPGRLLLFRMGDFYELFGDDAVTASSILGIALTSRDHGDSGKLPMAGVPHHTLNRYLTKLLQAGFKVAVCDQVEDPKQAKGIVKREVTEVFTPGSITLDGALETDKPNYLAGISFAGETAGLALMDITTGRFMIDEFPSAALADNLSFHRPSEVIVPDAHRAALSQTLASAIPLATVTPIDDYRFDASLAYGDLVSHFKTTSLDGFGLGQLGPAIGAAGAVLAYVKDLKSGRVGQITRIERLHKEQYMELDAATIKNLELVETPYEGRKNSLLSVIDRTQSPGGGRLLRNWLLSPLTMLELIEARQEAVKSFRKASDIRKKAAESLKGMPDLERLSTKVAMKKAGPRDIAYLRLGLEKVIEIKTVSAGLQSQLITESLSHINDFSDLINLIAKAIIDDPPATLQDGGLFKRGYSPELDNLILGIDEAKKYIHDLQKIEREKTGITSLKVGYNRVFGYYIEVTRPHLSKVPSYFIRKQTLVAAERFITEELKTKEELILNAEEKIKTLEFDLYDKLLGEIGEHVAKIQDAAGAISTIDVILGFASMADQTGYIIPTIDQSLEIEIHDGRHPVLETILPPGKFVPNDIFLDGAKKRLGIITGPNMAGKSTFLRQVGLLTLMAQIGAPIPANKARIGICDRIFTRVGASDDIIRGRSTFMVEMTEAAAILNTASDRSLILLDELGRGTSTYDGLSIAWSLVEYLSNVRGKQARTLFATHYHELIELGEDGRGVFNLQVGVKQWQDSIVFLYKILPGGCDDSYGIQVARLAGLPERLLDRAREILSRLESEDIAGKGKSPNRSNSAFQISLFSPEEDKLKRFLSGIDPEKLTPLEALNILVQLKKISGEQGD
ncbi:MAG TPA: DNA mismatch repair protein MutS [candidate division Zixibacteria bacterium]|nr:DNA mismatch repair protein MutS [candidate division Zixibacteria bacterium]